MRKRTSPTILEQAIIAVPEFEQVIKKLSEQVTSITAIRATSTKTFSSAWPRLPLSRIARTSSSRAPPAAARATLHKPWGCTPATWYTKHCITTLLGSWMK